ncbi:hypothetical protein AB6A40_005958 [Gnathostoma spinigerum]|uniref:Uncharacterized protein n=1 Tax=Gnathostoma spinigerum TaxID=75299 RepID=A0ABD6EPM0_9BILA
MNSNTTATVRTRAGTSRNFLLETFNYVIDEVMRRATQNYASNILLYRDEEELTDLEYSDDTAVVADNQRELASAVTASSDYRGSSRLLHKPSKTKLLTTKPMRFPTRIVGEKLENVKSFCSLGPVITVSTVAWRTVQN